MSKALLCVGVFTTIIALEVALAVSVSDTYEAGESSVKELQILQDIEALISEP